MRNTIPVINSILLLGLIAVFLYTYIFSDSPRKVAFVDNDRILTEYIGFKEGSGKFLEEKAKLESNLEVLKKEFESAVAEYRSDVNKFSKEEKEGKERELTILQRNLEKYQKTIQQQILVEDKKLTAGIVAQIDSYIQEYGKQNHYDLILGANNQGNLLFAKEGIDITDKLIDYLNQKYQDK